MKFGFVAKHRGIWPADWLCGALSVAWGGFYDWLTRPRSLRARAMKSGPRRCGQASRRARGLTAPDACGTTCWPMAWCGLHRIERLMRQQALRARPRRRRLPPDPGERGAMPSLPTCSTAPSRFPAPNRKWIAGFTYIWTAEGWLYVAAVAICSLAGASAGR